MKSFAKGSLSQRWFILFFKALKYMEQNQKFGTLNDAV